MAQCVEGLAVGSSAKALHIIDCRAQGGRAQPSQYPAKPFHSLVPPRGFSQSGISRLSIARPEIMPVTHTILLCQALAAPGQVASWLWLPKCFIQHSGDVW